MSEDLISSVNLLIIRISYRVLNSIFAAFQNVVWKYWHNSAVLEKVCETFKYSRTRTLIDQPNVRRLRFLSTVSTKSEIFRRWWRSRRNKIEFKSFNVQLSLRLLRLFKNTLYQTRRKLMLGFQSCITPAFGSPVNEHWM